MLINSIKTACLILSLQFFVSVEIFSQYYVFFGSFNRDKTAESLFVYELDSFTGKLSKVSALKNLQNPSFLTIAPKGKYIYACTESKTQNAGSVCSFEFNPIDKTLKFLNSQKSGGEIQHSNVAR